MIPSNKHIPWLNVIYAGIVTVAISLSASFISWALFIFNLANYPVYIQELINGRGSLMYLLIFTIAFNVISGVRILRKNDMDASCIRQYLIESLCPLLIGLFSAAWHARIGMMGLRTLVGSRASPITLGEIKASYMGVADGVSIAAEFVMLGVLGTALSLMIYMALSKRIQPHNEGHDT